MIGTPDPARWTEQEPERFGLMSGYAWRTDPKHVLFTLARYKFVAQMLAGRDRVLEIGCGDAFGTRLVADVTRVCVTAIDLDPMMLASGRDQTRAWGMFPKIDIHRHNIVTDGPVQGHDAAYAIDVLEHIHPADDQAFMTAAAHSITPDGTLILGTPSAESQGHASEPSKEGHINCKTQAQLRELCAKHFKTVFMFGQNDEVIHTGFGPMCHYLWAVCVTPRYWVRTR